MSKADIFRAYCLSKVGLPYYLGEEFDHNAGPTLTPREDGDCSGIYYAACIEAKVLYKGRALSRETADTYYGMSGARIASPSKVGDCCWFPKTGTKTHMAVYIGKGQVFEAGNHGPGGVYPGHGYVGLCTVAEMNRRGAVWGRLDTDIGELEDEEMDQATFDKMADDWAKRNMATTYAPDVSEARRGCEALGFLEQKHRGAKFVATDLFRVALWRLAKKAGLA